MKWKEIDPIWLDLLLLWIRVAVGVCAAAFILTAIVSMTTCTTEQKGRGLITGEKE